jgi:hypothetical protein
MLMIMRFGFLIIGMVFSLSVPALAKPGLNPVDAEYGHFYRVACIPPLHYFAITREDYRGSSAATQSKPAAREQLLPFGLYATPGFGTCALGKNVVAWNVSGEDWRAHISLNDTTVVERVAILPADDASDPMISGFELITDAAPGVHELAVHGVWKQRSEKQKRAIGLAISDVRAKRWFPKCDDAQTVCASYHFIQFSADLAKPKGSKAKAEPVGSSSNLHTPKGTKR